MLKVSAGRRLSSILVLATYFGIFAAFVSPNAYANVCSVVQIQIQQELTLERQAFEAHMRITNGLDLTPLENIEINVWFEDADGNTVLASSDPDNPSALFFIVLDRVDGLSGNIDGAGTISAGAQADIFWLIIPASGAGGEGALGELYQVGASLSYDFGGDSEAVEVAPDFIQVRPMPMLTLDYFLPEEVIGEDPLAPGEQVPTPFPLAVRVKNSGFGPANNLAIESAQPEIVENNQGLLINFELLNTQVNDGPVLNSLLADFGDLAAGESATAIWEMVVSLYGRFVSFDADYYHSDSLGGELTSLIEDVNTHTLVGVVLNDLSGQDARRDFLARDGQTLTLFASDGVDSQVTDQSDQSSLVLVDQGADFLIYQWDFPITAGPVYARLLDPTDGEGQVSSIWRSDGRSISGQNYWQRPSKPDQSWINELHLFDLNSTGSYQVSFIVDSVGDPPGLIIEAPGALTTDEDGLQSSFSVALSAPPTTTVFLPVASDDGVEGSVVPSTLTFDANNWDQPQIVTVNGLDDDWLDGDQPYQVLLGPSSSDDANFAGLDHPPLSALNLDNDFAGLIVSPATGLATAGPATSARFDISLSARPLEPVNIAVDSNQPQWGAPLVSSITLDSDNWETGMEMTIVGQDGSTATVGNQFYTITATVNMGSAAWLAAEPEAVGIIHRAGPTWGLAAGRVELPAVTDSSAFIGVNFEHSFDSVPVVILLADDGEKAPASVRLGEVEETGFSLVQVQPTASFSLSAPTVVHYLAMEVGRYVLPGGAAIEAGITSVSAVQAGGAGDAWEQVAFNERFNAAPGFFPTLQSLVNEQANIPLTGSSPWLTVATQGVSEDEALVALERSGLTEGSIDSAEQIGWIALHGHFGQFESGAGLVEWQSTRGDPVLLDSSCAGLSPWLITASDAVVAAGLRQRDSAGGWLRLCTDGEGNPGISLNQPDASSLRGPGAVGVDAMMFSFPFQTRLLDLPDSLFRDRFHQETVGQTGPWLDQREQ